MKKLQLVIFLLGTLVVNAQVHLQTGAAQYSYPIVSYLNNANSLPLKISIDYTAGNGVKVNDLASNIGLGWSLNAGGYIQRIQSGEPDDQNSTSLFPVSDICTNNTGSFNSTNSFRVWENENINYVDNYFPNGFLYSEYSSVGDINSCAWPYELAFTYRFPRFHDSNLKWKRSRRSLADRMQDVFVFNFNGRTGSFYIGKNGEILLTQDSKLKISFSEQNMLNQSIRTRISEFSITDEVGVIYKFNALELSEVMQWKETISNEPISWNTSTAHKVNIINGEPIGAFTVQRWFLTEIVNPRTSKKIILNYTDVNYDYIGGFDIKGSSLTPNINVSVVVIENRTKLKSKQLLSIVMPDGYKAEFEYHNQDRVDEGGQQTKSLKAIKYLYNSSLLKTWFLDQKYFYKNQYKTIEEGAVMTTNDKRFLRLCLLSIKQCGSDDLTCSGKTEFEYYNGSNALNYHGLPPMRCIAQDYWGYYTAPQWEQVYNENYPNASYFVYYLYNSVGCRAPFLDFAVMGAIKKIKTENGGFTEFQYELNRSINGITSMNNVNECVGGLRVLKILTNDGENTNKTLTTEYKYEKTDGSSSGWGHENLITSTSQTASVYEASDGYIYEGIEQVQYSNRSKHNGGTDATLVVNEYINFLYDPVGYIQRGFIRALNDIFSPGVSITTNTVNIKSYYPYSLMNPIQFQYSRVVQESYTNTFSTGKIITEFSDPSYFNSTIPVVNYPIEPKMRYAPWKYGLVTKRSIHNTGQSGSLVVEEIYTYNANLLEQQVTDVNFRSIKIEPITTRSIDFNDALWGYLSTDIVQKPYFPIRGRVELITKKTRQYSNATLHKETITDFTYDANNYQLKEAITKNSLGENVGEKTYYPLNYPLITGGALEAMRNQNMINIPVAKILWKQNLGSTTKKVLSATITEYSQANDFDYKPYKIYQSEISEPTASPITDDASVAGNLLNYPFLRPQSTIIYNGKGNPIEQKGVGNKYKTIVYDYESHLPVATVTNAKASDAAYTSFETNTTSGTWVYPVSAVTNLQSGITGSYSLQLSGTNNVYTNNYINPNASYKVSFWVKGSKPQITATTPYNAPVSISENVILKRSVLGWNYYEGTLTISGSVVSRIVLTPLPGNSIYIDELRLYPLNASMSTVTYYPGVGKTSECDINSRLTFYQYDALGRLISIRNEQWDIIKAYEYNHRQ